MMRVQIVTCNTHYDGKQFIGTYHEIHEIDNLRNVDHIIYTISSIIKNHIRFKPINDSLDMVIICGSNFKMIQDAVNHFKDHPIGVDIIETETANIK